MKCLILFAVAYISFVQPTIAAVSPLKVPFFFHDSTLAGPVQPVPTATRKDGSFFGKVKAAVLSFLLKPAAPKPDANVKRTLNIVSLSLLITGLGVPILGGPIAFLWLIPASVIAAVAALVAKNKDEGTPQTGGKKKQTSNAAAITVLAFVGGMSLVVGLLALLWHPHF